MVRLLKYFFVIGLLGNATGKRLYTDLRSSVGCTVRVTDGQNSRYAMKTLCFGFPVSMKPRKKKLTRVIHAEWVRVCVV